MPDQATSDASFYALVHYLLTAGDDSDALAFDSNVARGQLASLQHVAPYLDGRLPSESEFDPVVCQHLSAARFSYLAAESPPFEHVVAALGKRSPIFLSAAIVREEPIVVRGESLRLIICRFIARIPSAEYGPLPGRVPPCGAALLGKPLQAESPLLA